MTAGQGDPRDWITIWQSELSAAATDRERAEAWSGLVGLWAEWARVIALSGLAGSDGSARPAARPSSAGAAAAADAPDARDRVIAGLAARVDELERRLATSG